MTTKQEVLANANDEQQKAIKHQDGACMIVAGPGSGKTKTVVSRTQYMILNGIDPSRICLFTFTNKAAGEMKERIKLAVGERADQITCGTYHSIAHRLLRRYAERVGFNKNFTILSPDDCKKILKKIGKARNVDPENLDGYISSQKDKVILPERALVDAVTEVDKIMANAYSDYQAELKRQMAMDFDDLIIFTILLFRNNEDIKARVNNQWQYITADEAHDSSPRDLEFIRLLGGTLENVCFILDDDQSIYGFRGADIEAVMNERFRYQDMQVFNLSRNYRCSQTVVNAAKSLIAKNTKLIDKTIRPARDYTGTPIIVSKHKSPQEEAARVIQYVKLLNKKGLKNNDIAILYRMSSASRVIEQAFNAAKIKCKIVGGTPFFNRAEVQDVLSYLKLIVNEHDVSSFKRAIAVPKRGIGEKTIEKIDLFSINYPGGPISIRQALDEIDGAGLTASATTKLKAFNEYLYELDEAITELSPKNLINKVCEDIDIIGYLQSHSEYKKNWEERLANIAELVNVAAEYNDIQELLSQAALYAVEEDVEGASQEAVNMLTMHSSKGLEYKAVIIVNCNEGTSPHYKSLTNKKQLEEERRLFYVAMTRAKDYLFMTFPSCVLVQGQLQYAKPSRFLKEINSQYIKMT